ncbi:MAG: hypothetical protein GYB66_02650 [Chloroflexi bacterium]|nr:hypothetical protein [Chloroflexota bacterium]
MCPLQDAPNSNAAKIRDTILSATLMTEGLTDDEAEPFIEWSMEQADRVGLMVQSEVELDEKRYQLRDFLEALVQLVVRRQNHDAGWLQAKLDTLDSQAVAVGLSPLTDTQRTALQNHSAKTNQELLNEMMLVYSPPVENAPEGEPDEDRGV